MTRAEDTRERILFGAEEVVLRDGVAHLTLEAAASQAGISKGGILYHFHTRAALVTAMVQRLSSSFDADLEREGGLSGRPGAFTKAYLQATFGSSGEVAEGRQRRLGAAVIAGVAADPELLEPLRERFVAWQHALVADGLWFTELLGLAPLEEDLRSSVRDELLAHLDSALAPHPAPTASQARTGRGTRHPRGGKNAP